MKVVEEEVTAAGGDLVRVAGGVVIDVIPVPLRPPILLGRIELHCNFRMPLERQHARERFTVGYRAVPAIVDRCLEDFDDLRRQEARCTHWIREHVDIGAGAGHVIRPARVGIGVDIKGQAGRRQPTEPNLGRGVVGLRFVQHRPGRAITIRGSIGEDDEILCLPGFALASCWRMPPPVSLGHAGRQRQPGRHEDARVSL